MELAPGVLIVAATTFILLTTAWVMLPWAVNKRLKETIRLLASIERSFFEYRSEEAGRHAAVPYSPFISEEPKTHAFAQPPGYSRSTVARLLPAVLALVAEVGGIVYDREVGEPYRVRVVDVDVLAGRGVG